MFDGLRKKFSDFVGTITKKETEKVEEQPLQEQVQEETRAQIEAEEPTSKIEEPERVVEENKEIQAPEEKEEHIEAVEKQIEAKPILHQEEPKTVEKEIEDSKEEAPAFEGEMPKPEPKTKSAAKSKMPKISFGTKLKGMVFGKVTIQEKDVSDYLETLKISLLQADVNYEIAEKLVDTLHEKLVNSQIDSRNIADAINKNVRESFFEILTKPGNVDIATMASAAKAANSIPFKILFIGPNGAGKTTTMAKVAHMLMEKRLSCMISASDTFRAAAIEQAAYHADKLNIPVIKGTYGADPASVAFNAISYAKAHSIDVVLIDSAGRQETNKNLIEEIKKMARISNAELKIFIGESLTGNSLLDQVREFDKAIGLNGIILTKLDCDAKGGNTISVISETSVPILFFGIGEKYTDLIEYDPKSIVDQIAPESLA